MQEIEYGSQFPHRAETPPRQLRRRRRSHQRRHDLTIAALLRRLVVLLLLLVVVVVLLLLLRSLCLPLLARRLGFRSIEPLSGSNGAGSGRPVTPGWRSRRRRRRVVVLRGWFVVFMVWGVVLSHGLFRGRSVGRDRRRRGFKGHGWRDREGLGKLGWDYV